jgi:hypothetical protein
MGGRICEIIFFFSESKSHISGGDKRRKQKPFFLMLWVNISVEGLKKFEIFFLGLGTILHPEKKISNTNTLFDNITTCKLQASLGGGVCML